MKIDWMAIAENALCAFIRAGQVGLIAGFLFLLWLVWVRA
jgi:hypothetical protein